MTLIVATAASYFALVTTTFRGLFANCTGIRALVWPVIVATRENAIRRTFDTLIGAVIAAQVFTSAAGSVYTFHIITAGSAAITLFVFIEVVFHVDKVVRSKIIFIIEKFWEVFRC